MTKFRRERWIMTFWYALGLTLGTFCHPQHFGGIRAVFAIVVTAAGAWFFHGVLFRADEDTL